MPSERDRLRRSMRSRRRALSRSARELAARQFARIAQRELLLRPARRAAVYFAYDCEADLNVLIRVARMRGCRLYLPALTDRRRKRMEFLEYRVGAALRFNRYGIAEPARCAAKAAVRRLDLVFVPLLAVDPCGSRLGSGAGYYDRCLRHLRAGRRWRRPKLIGVAYEFQRVAHLDPQPWDVPLDALLTERTLYRLRARRA